MIATIDIVLILTSSILGFILGLIIGLTIGYQIWVAKDNE